MGRICANGVVGRSGTSRHEPVRIGGLLLLQVALVTAVEQHPQKIIAPPRRDLAP
jgi:hypothetical protein